MIPETLARTGPARSRRSHSVLTAVEQPAPGWLRGSEQPGTHHAPWRLGQEFKQGLTGMLCLYLGVSGALASGLHSWGTEGPALQGVLGQCRCQVWPAIDRAPLHGPSLWLLRTGDSSYLRNPCGMGGRGLKPTFCKETFREVWTVSHVESGQAPSADAVSVPLGTLG